MTVEDAQQIAHGLIQGYILPRLGADAPSGSPARLERSSRSGSPANRALGSLASAGAHVLLSLEQTPPVAVPPNPRVRA